MAADENFNNTFKGQASREGRLVIDNVKPGDHTLRVSSAGKKDYKQQVTVVAGQVARVQAALAEVEKRAPGPGEVVENPKDRLKYVWIPPRTFLMGCSPDDSECSSDEKPAHQVTISKGFWIGQTEATVGAVARYGPLDEVAWYDKDSGKGAHEVGQKRPNAFNLYDMLGNVWE